MEHTSHLRRQSKSIDARATTLERNHFPLHGVAQAHRPHQLPVKTGSDHLVQAPRTEEKNAGGDSGHQDKYSRDSVKPEDEMRMVHVDCCSPTKERHHEAFWDI